ncbi:hypothetical protein DBT_0847 [Dissulfuribacter thermophilus]|uniref:Uncharacterized protein n=1 Tax=Dissulfuribacter thermophilus TaxID=1156395 RepID=A0A1B9F7M7_9BACT|nr:hypothetical protein DBT_0847 [Dissulfuribacter thermophilus]
MPKIRGARGEDVLRYFEPRATKKIGQNRQSRRAAKEGKKSMNFEAPKR